MRANDPPDDSSGPTEKELAAAKDAALQCLALHRYCYGKCWMLTSHLKNKKITVTEFITQVDSFCKDLGLQWQRCALVLTDGVEELILKRSGTLIEIGKRKFATAHEAVVGMAISLGGSIFASRKLFKPKAAKNAIEKMELALVAQKIDWDGLKAEIKVEFGRAVAGLQPVTSLAIDADACSPVVSNLIRHADVMKRLDASTKSVHRYAQAVDVKTPQKKDHKYTIKDVVNICQHAESNAGSPDIREKASAYKVELLKHINRQVAK